MATHPLPPGQRQVNLEMPEAMVRYLDQRAREKTTTAVRCSRASYLRDLIEADMISWAASRAA